MGTRKIKDAELDGEKVYFASHAKATYLSDGRGVENAMASKLQTVEGILSYDYKKGYPCRPAF